MLATPSAIYRPKCFDECINGTHERRDLRQVVWSSRSKLAEFVECVVQLGIAAVIHGVDCLERWQSNLLGDEEAVVIEGYLDLGKKIR